MTCRRVRRRRSALLFLLGAAIVALPAAATTVNGTLTIDSELGRIAEEQDRERAGPLQQHFWRVPNGAVKVAPPPVVPARDLAVAMEAASGQAAAPAGGTRDVYLRGAGLEPAAIAVPPRTRITFRNEDPFFYELSCASNPNMSGAGPIEPGGNIAYSFDEPGVYQITDRRLPHLVGYVVVVNTPTTANPQPAERPGGASFSFENVQPGQYRVKVFYRGDWIADQPLEVAEEQEEVGVTIRLPSDQQQHEQAETETAEEQ